MNRNTIVDVVLISVVLLNGGCASIVSRSKYKIPLKSNLDAVVEVRNCGKLVTSAHLPTTLELPSGAGFFARSCYTFTFKREGYPDVVKTRDAYMNGWYLGNIIFGGLLGLLIVDPATGAMYRLDENPIDLHYEPSATPGDDTGVVR